jgi:hypothetical protein
LVTSGLEQLEGLLGVAERGVIVALVLGYPAKVLMDAGLTGAVVELPVQLEALRQVGAGLSVVTGCGAG